MTLEKDLAGWNRFYKEEIYRYGILGREKALDLGDS